MRTGHWVWTFSPDFNSGASGSGLQRILFSIDDGADSTLQVYEDLLFLTGNGTTRFIGSMSFTSSSSCTVELECATGDVTLSGFTTGNGVHSGTAWTWDDGTLYVGQNDDGSLAFTGSYSDVEDFNTAVTGTSASTQPGLVAAAVAPVTIASRADGVVLDLSSDQPPSELPESPSHMRTGRWRFTFTPDSDSNFTLSDYKDLFGFGGEPDALTIQGTGVSQANLQVWVSNSPILTAGISYSSAQPVTVEVDPSVGTLTVSGATTGNGTIGSTPWSWPTGTFGIGNTAGNNVFDGTFSDVFGFTDPQLGGLTAAAVGTLTVEGSSASTLDELTVTGTGVNDTEGQVIAQAEPLVADGAGAIGYGGAGAATLPGLETSAAGAMEITGTCAADMAGLECSATAVAVTADVDITMDGLVGTGVGVVNVSAGDVELTLAGLDAAGVGTLEMTGAAAIELPGLLAGSIGDSGMLTIPTGGQFVSSGGTLQRTAVLYGSPDAGAFVPPAHGTLAQTYPIIQHAGAPPAGAFVSHRSNWPAGLPVGPASAVMPVLVLSAVAPLSISGSAAMVLELLNVSAGSSGGVVTGAANMTIELTCAAFGGATLLTDRAGLPLTDRSGVQLTSRS